MLFMSNLFVDTRPCYIEHLVLPFVGKTRTAVMAIRTTTLPVPTTEAFVKNTGTQCCNISNQRFLRGQSCIDMESLKCC